MFIDCNIPITKAYLKINIPQVITVMHQSECYSGAWTQGQHDSERSSLTLESPYPYLIAIAFLIYPPDWGPSLSTNTCGSCCTNGQHGLSLAFRSSGQPLQVSTDPAS